MGDDMDWDHGYPEEDIPVTESGPFVARTGSLSAEIAALRQGVRVADAALDRQTERLAAAEAQVRELREALEEIETSPSEMIEMFRREGFVFERDLSGELDDAGRWEKLAFTLYCKIVALASSATEALGENRGEG
jgi:hypothetical protein